MKGFCMGIADIIPGVSGGTLALILGIYEEWLEAIKSIDGKAAKLLMTFRFKEAFRHIQWKILLPLGFGVVTAVLILSKPLHWLLENKAYYVYAFFFGLIVATIPLVMRHVKHWSGVRIGLFIFSSIAFYFFVGLSPVQTPQTWWFIMFSGAVAICAMILPGISGSFILVLLGKYTFIIESIATHQYLNVGIFLIGICIGILSFVRVVSWLLKNFHDATLAVLTGLMIGSLRKIWPWKHNLETVTTSQGKIIPLIQENYIPNSMNSEIFITCMMAVVGCGVVYFLSHYSKKAVNI